MDRQHLAFVFRARAFISLLTAVSFVFMSISGIILFIAPSGRRAGDWSVWSLSRGEWIAQHLSFSAVFLIAAIVHLWLNRKPLLNYLKLKTKAAAGLRWEWLAVVLLTGVVVWGTLAPFEPFTSLIQWRDHFHRHTPAAQDQTVIETAGMGQITLADYCRQNRLDTDRAIEMLNAQEIAADPSDTLRTIADRGNLHPSRLRSLLDAARL